MKRLIAVFAFMVVSLFPAICSAEEEHELPESADYEYYINDEGTVTISGWKGEEEILKVPADIDGITVAEIGGWAFYYCDNLTSIELPDTITTIGERAFIYCENLTSIELPDTVTIIGEGAFEGCTNLTDIKLSDSVTTIGDEAFGNCFSLTSIELPNSLTMCGINPFIGCPNLTQIKISSNNKYYEVIDNVLFNKTEKTLICYPCGLYREECIIPEGIQAIGERAFDCCTNLTDIELPGSITAIGARAFYYCENLTNIELPDLVTLIGEEAFYGCSGLTSIEIPDSVTIIEANTFHGCSNLMSIVIPDSVTWISYPAFGGCDNLTITVIPGSYAADYCEENSLTYIYLDGDEELNNYFESGENDDAITDIHDPKGENTDSENDLCFSSAVIYDKKIALINGYDAFLSVADDNDTLMLSNEPYFWVLKKGENGSLIVSAEHPDLLFDLDNAEYEAGSKVHLYEETGYECQYWNLTTFGNGYLITSAETGKSDWCVASAERGFYLEKITKANKNDTWRIVEAGSWAETYVSPASYPFYRQSDSYTPTPEFWGKFDAEGITDEMRAEDTDEDEVYAQYAFAVPVYDELLSNIDFFSVEFYTDTQPFGTYWELAGWYMNCDEYIWQNEYEYVDSVGAYAGLQSVSDHTGKIMSMWEMNFYKEDGSMDTLVPECIYPAEEMTQFDNEGSGSNLLGVFEWDPQTWYRFVLRSWEEAGSTYVGTWVENLSTNEISLLAAFDTFLPKSSISGIPEQFLENFGPDTHGEYRQMKLRNYCMHTSDSDKWIFPDTAEMSIWATLELDNRGTYRFSADGDTITVETCGIGEDACEGMTDEETVFTVHITPAETAPDISRYEMPEVY